MCGVNSVTIRTEFFVLVKVLVQIVHTLAVRIKLPFVFDGVVNKFDQKHLHPLRCRIEPGNKKFGIVKLLLRESPLNEIKWLDPLDRLKAV